MQDSTAEFRSMLDGIAQQVVDRAQEMIRQGMNVNAAFKMAIAWELEIQLKAVIVANHATQIKTQSLVAQYRYMLRYLPADEYDDAVKLLDAVGG